MIIGGSKLMVELQEVFETGLAYRVLVQTLPRDYNFGTSCFVKAVGYPEINDRELFIRGDDDIDDHKITTWNFKSTQARADYIKKVIQALIEINKPEPLTFARIKKECVPMKHLLVDGVKGRKRLYLGFNRAGQLITDTFHGDNYGIWHGCDIGNWTIEPYEASDETK